MNRMSRHTKILPGPEVLRAPQHPILLLVIFVALTLLHRRFTFYISQESASGSRLRGEKRSNGRLLSTQDNRGGIHLPEDKTPPGGNTAVFCTFTRIGDDVPEEPVCGGRLCGRPKRGDTLFLSKTAGTHAIRATSNHRRHQLLHDGLVVGKDSIRQGAFAKESLGVHTCEAIRTYVALQLINFSLLRVAFNDSPVRIYYTRRDHHLFSVIRHTEEHSLVMLIRENAFRRLLVSRTPIDIPDYLIDYFQHLHIT